MVTVTTSGKYPFGQLRANGRYDNKSIDASNWIVQRYLDSLRTADLEQVPALELAHTLCPNLESTTAETLSSLIDQTDLESDLYRDATGTLVVRQQEEEQTRLCLLWPVHQRPKEPNSATEIVGSQGEVFIMDHKSGEVTPLPAVGPGRCEYAWGTTDAEVVNLYLAIVYSVDGVQAPQPRPRHSEHPDSLYGWLARRDKHQEICLGWEEARHLVEADRPLRDAAGQAAGQGFGSTGALFAPVLPT